MESVTQPESAAITRRSRTVLNSTKNHLQVLPNLLPAIQAHRWRLLAESDEAAPRSKAASIGIAFRWKDDAMQVRVVANGSDQTGLTQSLETGNPTTSKPTS